MKTTIGIIVAAITVSALVYFLRGDPTVKERDGQFYDAIEDDPNVQPILAKAGAEARELFLSKDPNLKNLMGFGNAVNAQKKQILKEKYGINWRTPKELNPHIAYD